MWGALSILFKFNCNFNIFSWQVKVSQDHENSAMTIILWKCEDDLGAAISIKNDTDLPIIVSQAAAAKSTLDILQQQESNPIGWEEGKQSKYCVCVPPGAIGPFGWADPETATAVLVSVGVPPIDLKAKAVLLGLSKLHMTYVLPLDEISDSTNSRGQGEEKEGVAPTMSTSEGVASSNTGNCIFLSVKPWGNGKVIHIVRDVDKLTTLFEDKGGGFAAQTGATVVAGAVVGTLVAGPVGGVMLAGGAYAYGCVAIFFSVSFVDTLCAINNWQLTTSVIICCCYWGSVGSRILFSCRRISL